jgi:uncharacterized membrane protein
MVKTLERRDAMKSKARIHTHPIHPMLIVLPLGLWVFSIIADVLYLWQFGDNWRIVSAYCMAGGVIGALIAAIPGFIDFTLITSPGARKIAIWHMVLNLGAVVLYSANFLLRYQNNYELEGTPFILSITTIVLITISGWLGGELVYVKKVGVIEEEQKPPRNRIKIPLGT